MLGPIQKISAQSSGSCAAGTCASWMVPANVAAITLQVSGTFTGTLTFESTSDGSNWLTTQVTDLSDQSGATTTTAAGQFAFANVGLVGVRARATAFSGGVADVSATQGYASPVTLVLP